MMTSSKTYSSQPVASLQFGFQLSTQDMDLEYINDASDDFPCEMGYVEKGLAIYLEIDLRTASSGAGAALASAMTSLAGDKIGKHNTEQDPDKEDDEDEVRRCRLTSG